MGSQSLFSRRLSRQQLIAIDCLAAVAYTAIRILFLIGQPPPNLPVWLASLIVAETGLPLAARRIHAVPVLGLVLGMTLLSALVGLAGDQFVAAAFALYMVALTTPSRRWEATPLIALLCVIGVAGMVAGSSAGVGGMTGLVTGLVVLGGAWTIGRAVRERRAYTARSADQLAKQAVADERIRIARELHDIVAHSMGVIAVKAGVANHLAADQPQAAREALRVIEATSRSALAETRHMLGVLRSETGPGDLAPAPGVARLSELSGRAAMAGVEVEMEVAGADDIPEGVGLSVYRIVQEALTNVVKHAAPARCRVHVEADGSQVRIEVTDDGPGCRVLPGGGGHGLAGMRERAAMYGGFLEAGPRAQGGFAVSAILPYAR